MGVTIGDDVSVVGVMSVRMTEVEIPSVEVTTSSSVGETVGTDITVDVNPTAKILLISSETAAPTFTLWTKVEVSVTVIGQIEPTPSVKLTETVSGIDV
ncbi:MAG: hypothetical protein QW815_00355 [Nitrososphaerota archaeon]